jgi:glycosyltransferase involved in cell wall biosynthesis
MQIIPELGPGGAEQGCLDVAAELVRAGSKSIVVSNGGSRVHELQRVKAIHIDLPVHSKNPVIMAKNIKRLRKLILKHQVDIVHVRSRAPAWSAYYACRDTNAKFMTTVHAPYNTEGRGKKFYNSIMTRGERIITISDNVTNYILHHYAADPNRIRQIYRGIALNKFHPAHVAPSQLIRITSQWRLPDGANIVLLPGRLTRWKGHHVMIDAMTRLNRKDVICVIIGADQGRTQYREELEAYIRERKLGGQVRIIDHCDDMPAAYMCAAVVVCPSIEPEGFGRVPVEAMAMGRPIVASAHGGAQETVIPGQTGWLVPPGDPDALAGAIAEAMDLDGEQLHILAANAMHHVASWFSNEHMLDQTLNVYAELLQEKYGYAPPTVEAARA